MSNTCNLLHISRVQVGLIQCEWLIISINFRKKLLGQISHKKQTYDYGQIGNRVSHDQWPTVISTTDQQKNSMLFSLLLHYTFLPPLGRLRVRATVKLPAVFFHDESSITIGRGGYESAIAPKKLAKIMHDEWSLVKNLFWWLTIQTTFKIDPIPCNCVYIFKTFSKQYCLGYYIKR